VFEKFTESARRVVVTAQEEARLLGHDYIGTEHLLLGAITACGESELGGISLAEARKVTDTLMPGKPPAPATHIPFTGRAKRSLEGALRESVKTGHNSITQWHVLLSVITDPENVAVQVLTAMRVDVERLRARAVAAMPSEDELRKAAVSDRLGADTRVTTLEHEVKRLSEQVAELQRRLGETS
jgi:ATP-dependent Clp protease ATP-binding subunit ClpC